MDTIFIVGDLLTRLLLRWYLLLLLQRCFPASVFSKGGLQG
jgi:hypothetical protein